MYDGNVSANLYSLEIEISPDENKGALHHMIKS